MAGLSVTLGRGPAGLVPLKDALEADKKGENPIKSAIKAPWGIIGRRV